MPRIAIVGSCVSRDGFARNDPSFTIHSYVARQTLAGIGTSPTTYEAGWYGSLNHFERACVVADLEKNAEIWRFEQGADILIVDYVDERFDLLALGPAVMSATKHMLQPAFRERYAATLRTIPRRSAEAMALWQAGAERFFARVLQTLPPERIILHEARWAPSFRAADGTLAPFHPAYRDLVGPNNALLESYHAFTRQRVPGISVWQPPEDVVFADPEHRWSKEPFHYVSAYYASFLSGLAELSAKILG